MTELSDKVVEVEKSNNIGNGLGQREYTPPNLNRNQFWLGVLKFSTEIALRFTGFTHIEMSKETRKLIRKQKHRKTYFDTKVSLGVDPEDVVKEEGKNIAILFIPPHISMYETPAIPRAIYRKGGSIPFILMGENVLQKKSGPLEAIALDAFTSIGCILVDRCNATMGALKLTNDTDEILNHGNNEMAFPEASRSRTGYYKKFGSAIFQGAINATKKNFSEVDQYNKYTDIYLVPVTPNYTKIPEFRNTPKEYHDFMTSKKSTFTTKDIKQYWIWYYDNYISFGKPILVKPTDDREELAKQCRQECMNLKTIQYVNVFSEAMVRTLSAPEYRDKHVISYESEYFEVNRSDIYKNMETVIKELYPYKDKFRGIYMKLMLKNLDKLSKRPIAQDQIIKRSRLPIDPRYIEKYTHYANQIKHYLPHSADSAAT